jgi:tRNA pseudouridine38-40 synthase
MNNESNSYYYLVTIAYDGSDFVGWATQTNKFTVQGYIEEVLRKIFQQKISILATSRTDKGVHVREQRFTFRINLPFHNKNLLNILKKALSKHILVKKVEKVDDDFRPIRNVINKEYRYFVNVGKINIFQKKYRWEYNLPSEVKNLNHILQIFQGKHNFFNYCYCRWQERESNYWTRNYFLKKLKKGKYYNY